MKGRSGIIKHVAGIAALVLLPLGLFAAESEHEEESRHQGDKLYHEEHGHHLLGIFLGITREHGENRETIGIEYTYRINRWWSVGGLVERAERDKSSTLTNVFVHFWPTPLLYVGGGYGRKDPGEEREHTWRLSIGYEIELGKSWSLGPQANIDFIENAEDEEVYGLVFARRF